jgi:microcystin-dependent protein
MATKIPRATQLQFGLNGDQSHYGQFGSAAAGSPFFTKDPATIQALDAFINNGFKEAVDSGDKAAFLEDLNGAFLLAFRQIAYLFQQGIPEWDPNTPYFTGGMAQDGAGNVYVSLVNGNIGNPLPAQVSNGFWQYFNPATVPSGSIYAFATSNPPLGYLNCDGSAYAQATYPNLYAVLGSTWNTFNGNSDPGAGNFRVPDLRSLTLMGVGQGNGFSARAIAQLVGEENHTLVVGEIPANLTVNDPGHEHGAPDGANFMTDKATRGIGYSTNAVFSDDSPNTTSAKTGISVGGGGGAHNNMQPTVGINWIIKT